MNAAQRAIIEKRKIILVVEDDSDMNSLVSDILIDAGYDVVTASNWKSAIHTAIELKPDLMILDVMLPDAYGIEKCEEMMEDSQTRIPVIMISAFNAQPIIRASFIAGAARFIYKPNLERDLLKETKNILNR